MRLYCSMLFGAAVLLAPLVPASAETPRVCMEGKTASGECVNPVLARVMRKHTIVATQPKFSYTAPLYLPSEDRFYIFGRDYHEMRVLFANPPCGGSAIC